MGKKYFVWSFDDGLEQDKKIVENLLLMCLLRTLVNIRRLMIFT